MGNLRVIANKRKKKKSGGSRVFIIVVSIFFIFYMSGYIITLMQKQKIPSARVVYGSIGTPEIINGIIIRTESVYRSNEEGVLFYYMGEGERVRRGGDISSVRNPTEIMAIESSLSSINNDILSTQKAREGLSFFSDDIRRENEKIKNLVDDSMNRFLDPNLSGVYNLIENVEKHMDLKNTMLLNESGGSLAGLAQERAVYESLLDNSISSIKAERSGIVSYLIDGFEELFTTETMFALNKHQTTMKPESKVTSSTVSEGAPIFKVVESNEWYIAAYIPTEMIANWQENAYRTIYVKNSVTEAYTPQDIFIVKMESQLDGETYVVMRCTRGILDFISERSIQFKITEGTYEGIKIPNSAIVDISLFKIPTEYLVELDNGHGIIKEASDTVEVVPVIIKGGDDATTLILQDFTGLKIGDSIVHPVSSERYIVSGIENVKGVYVLNTGIAEFKRITLDDSTPSNSMYTILDKDTNLSIRAYDIIVSDAKNVTEGQTIF